MIPVARNKASKRSKKKQAAHNVALLTPDHTYLTFGHHKAIIAALALLPCLSVNTSAAPSDQSESVKGVDGACTPVCAGQGDVAHQMKVLVVGLGGGALPMFICKCVPNCFVDVVELDEEVLLVAEKWFGFCREKRLTVHIADGVTFISECVSANRLGVYDAIILDVDSKDVSAGVSSPPQAFVDRQFLTNMRLLLKESGIFLTNVAARNQKMRIKLIRSVSNIYSNLVSIPIPEDINEVLVGLPSNTVHAQTADSQITLDHSQKGSTAGQMTVPVDLTSSLDVSESLARLAAVVSMNSISKVEAQDLIAEWTNFLSAAKCIGR